MRCVHSWWGFQAAWPTPWFRSGYSGWRSVWHISIGAVERRDDLGGGEQHALKVYFPLLMNGSAAVVRLVPWLEMNDF